MKKQLHVPMLFMLFVCIFLTGCGIMSTGASLDIIEKQVENKYEVFEENIEREIERKTTSSDTVILTEDVVLAIALEHANLSASDVSFLHTEYDIDDGVPEYEVQFHYERWEYSYDIHAETGEIRSFEKDD